MAESLRGRGGSLLFGAALMASMLGPVAAGATSMKECSLKYKAAKSAGTLNGEDWKAFRAAQCGSAATPVAAGTPAPGTASGAAAPAAAPATSAAAAPAVPATKAAAPVTVGNATFPSAIDPKFASLSAGKGRMKTCGEQYKANKASGGNGGLKWIQKGGGYYSLCNKHLKGTA